MKPFKVAIVIDDWKLHIFAKELKDAGFEFTQADGDIDGTLFIYVTTSEVAKLHGSIVLANTKAALEKNRQSLN